MRALITGAAGFAAGHLAEHLVTATDWEVWGNVLPGEEKWVRPVVKCIVADMRDPQAVLDLVDQVQPDYVFHLAAQAFVPESWANPWDTYETNLRSQINLLEALRSHAALKGVLIVGSNEEYGLVTPDNLPLTEDSPLRPTSPYSVSKIAQDFGGLQYFLTYGLPVVRVRPFNHIGPRQNERFVSSAFAQQIALIEAERVSPPLKVGNLRAQRDFTDVRDMMRAYKLALEKGEAGEVYNIGSGKPRSIQNLLDTLLACSEMSIDVEVDPKRMRPSDVPISYCDATKFQSRTGWTASIPFEQTMRDVLDDWRTRIKESGE